MMKVARKRGLRLFLRLGFLRSVLPGLQCGQSRDALEAHPMNEKKFGRIVNHPRHIPGVHNYCDRWCECCPFTLRCSVFAVEAEMMKDAPPRARGIENLWPRMDAATEMASDMLQAHIEHPGVKPVKDPIFKSVARRAGFHRIGVAAKRYMEFAHVFVKAHGQTLEALPPDDAVHPISAAEAFEVIAWFHLFITVKLSRTLSQREHEEDEIADDPELAAMPRDQDGSAKIALIGIDRSITAWAILSLHQPAHADAARSAMLTLSRLRTAIEKDFPKARLFVRPGFDTHTFPKRKKKA
jgi:hypothetical protein